MKIRGTQEAGKRTQLNKCYCNAYIVMLAYVYISAASRTDIFDLISPRASTKVASL
jgi:hypothetical protein